MGSENHFEWRLKDIFSIGSDWFHPTVIWFFAVDSEIFMREVNEGMAVARIEFIFASIIMENAKTCQSWIIGLPGERGLS